MGKEHWRGWLVSLLLFGTLGYGVYAWSFTDRVAFLPPLVGQRLEVRHDPHGQGVFGAPRSGRRLHRGIDLVAPVGTPVRAVQGGWVTVVQRDRGMGNYVVIRHHDALETLYAHLSRLDVRPGQHVRQGATIGTVGKTGNARAHDMAPHLHFEIHEHGRPVDPVKYLHARNE